MDDDEVFQEMLARALADAPPSTLVGCQRDEGVITLVFAAGGGRVFGVALGEPEALFVARSIHDEMEYDDEG